MYTDASSRGGIGVAWVVPGGATQCLAARTDDDTTGMAELTAIFFGVLLSHPDKALTVFTDSQDALNRLLATVQHRAVGKNARAEQLGRTIVWMTKLRTAPTTFAKIKAHAGVEGNEVADTLARAGRRCAPWPRVPCATSASQYASLLRVYVERCGIDARHTVLRNLSRQPQKPV